MKKETIQPNNRGKNQFDYPIRLYTNKDWLYQKYVIEKLSYKKISRLCNVSSKSGTTIGRWVKHFGFVPHKSKGIGEENGNWRGGTYISAQGYKYVHTKTYHPRAVHKGEHCSYIPEHVLVAEEILGRQIKPKEHIHHLNGDKLDNKKENLRIFATEAEHHQYEANLTKFAKQLIWGNINPEIGQKVKELFEKFLKKL